MTHKYAVQIRQAGVEACPPAEHIELEVGYRLVKNNPVQMSDFQPQAIGTPARVIPRRGPVVSICSYYGLSMFDTQDAIERFRDNLSASLLEKLGEMIAHGPLDEGDGVACDHSETSGHFTFHEDQTADLSQKFEVA